MKRQRREHPLRVGELKNLATLGSIVRPRLPDDGRGLKLNKARLLRRRRRRHGQS